MSDTEIGNAESSTQQDIIQIPRHFYIDYEDSDLLLIESDPRLERLPLIESCELVLRKSPNDSENYPPLGILRRSCQAQSAVLPPVGSILQLDSLLYFSSGVCYEVEQLKLQRSKGIDVPLTDGIVGITRAETRWTVKTAPVNCSTSPRIIGCDEEDQAAPVHPLDVSHSPTSSRRQRIRTFLYCNEDTETDEPTLLQHSFFQNRNFVHVHGLSSYGVVSVDENNELCTKRTNISTGGWSDQKEGLTLALEEAHCNSPSVLVIHRFHQEDNCDRIISVILEGLAHPPVNNSSLPQVSAVVVALLGTRPVIDSIQPLLIYDPLELAPPLSKILADHFASKEISDLSLGDRSYSDIKYLCEKKRDGSCIETLCKRLDEQAKCKPANIPTVTWKDVGGLAEARREIMEAIEIPLRFPHLFKPGTTRSGVLLYGPPGTGKTLVAKAVANECGIPFLSVKGPELLGSYVGESEANIRATFSKARTLAKPATILFFDELDSLAPRRGHADSGGNVMDRVIATFFTELDRAESIFFMGATNRPDLLDPALLRPGRLDRLVYLGVESTDREHILRSQMRTLRVESDLDEMAAQVSESLRGTYTGADLSAIVKGALLLATERLCAKAENQICEELPSIDAVLETWSEEDLEPVVTMEDLLTASDTTVPSVSTEELSRYTQLREQLMS